MVKKRKTFKATERRILSKQTIEVIYFSQLTFFSVHHGSIQQRTHEHRLQNQNTASLPHAVHQFFLYCCTSKELSKNTPDRSGALKTWVH